MCRIYWQGNTVVKVDHRVPRRMVDGSPGRGRRRGRSRNEMGRICLGWSEEALRSSLEKMSVG